MSHNMTPAGFLHGSPASFQSLIAQRTRTTPRPIFRTPGAAPRAPISATGAAPIINADVAKNNIRITLKGLSFSTDSGAVSHGDDNFNVDSAMADALSSFGSPSISSDSDIYLQLCSALDDIIEYGMNKDMITEIKTAAAEATDEANRAAIAAAALAANADADADADPFALFGPAPEPAPEPAPAVRVHISPQYAKAIMADMLANHPSAQPMAGPIIEMRKMIRTLTNDVLTNVAEEHDNLLNTAIDSTLTTIDTEVTAANNLITAIHTRVNVLTGKLEDAEEAASVIDDVTPDHNEHLYERATIELCQLAEMMRKYEAAADVYKAKHYEIQQVELLGVDAEGVQSMLDSIDTSAPLLKSKLQILSDKITAVEASIISLNKNIRTVLTSYCNIPERVRQEQTISTTTIKLPEKLANGKPDPLVAEELVTVMIKLMCTYPDQLWAIIPALTRLVNDEVSDASNSDPWVPPLLESNYAEIPQELCTFYAQHNKRLYDTLLNINRLAVQRALSTFSTGDDSASRKRTTLAHKDDGISVIMWHIHYHEQSGYQIRCELASYLSYAHGAFSDGDPLQAVAAVRKKLNQAVRLKIKIEYDMTIRRVAEVLRHRDVAFQGPMTDWMSCQDMSKQSDCISMFDPFLAEIERAARNVADVLPSLNDKTHQQARALFAQFSNTVSESFNEQPSHRGGGGGGGGGGKPKRQHAGGGDSKQWTCPVKNCGANISAADQAGHLERIKKGKASGRRVAQILCRECLTKLKTNGSVEYESGSIRKWHEKTGSANVAEIENGEKQKKKQSKKAEPPSAFDMEAVSKLLDERFAQMATAVQSVHEAAEPEPEPAPAPESFSMQIAKAIVSRGPK